LKSSLPDGTSRRLARNAITAMITSRTMIAITHRRNDVPRADVGTGLNFASVVAVPHR